MKKRILAWVLLLLFVLLLLNLLIFKLFVGISTLIYLVIAIYAVLNLKNWNTSTHKHIPTEKPNTKDITEDPNPKSDQ